MVQVRVCAWESQITGVTLGLEEGREGGKRMEWGRCGEVKRSIRQ